MGTIHTEASATIPALPETIYAVLSDYHVGHPAILPKPYFTALVIEQGGQGAGTVVQVHMTVMGAKRAYRMTVSEPNPGRVLVETDAEAGVVTTFTIEPVGSDQSRVTITTDSRPSPGLGGFLEGWITPPITRRIYSKELAQLAAYVRDHPSPEPGA